MSDQKIPFPDDSVDFATILRRLRLGATKTVALAIIGLAIGALIFIVAAPILPVTTSARVVFSFRGYERGLYPDGSKFQAEDVIAPDIVETALRRLALDSSPESQAKIRSAFTIEGLIPPTVVTERDRLRAAGQTPPPFIPDEHRITFTARRGFTLSEAQRTQLLHEVVAAYRERFQRTFATFPITFGNVFDALKDADFFEYELILQTEVSKLQRYLDKQIDEAKNFRSSTTNLSFGDLQERLTIFQLRLTEPLSYIRRFGLARDRTLALAKMDYYLQTVLARERESIAENEMIAGLLTKTQERANGYILGIKSEATKTRAESPVIDQNLIDSLLANDAFNFLVRQSLAAGQKLKTIQAEKELWLERRRAMAELARNLSGADQTELINLTQRSIGSVKQIYDAMIIDFRNTHNDYARQFYADAVRESMQPVSENYFLKLASAAITGLAIGLALGLGLSLLLPPEEHRQS